MPRFEPFDWYDQALYYDIVFDADTSREADFLQAAQKRYALTRGTRLLEPACGSGRLVAAMARRGYRVIGFDISDGILRFARQRLRDDGLTARLFHARMEHFHLPPNAFDLAHCLVSTFKYLLDESAARAHLKRMVRVLKPGGIYALGLHLTDYTDPTASHERWVASRGDIHVTCNIHGWPPDRRRRLERVRSRLTVRDHGRERRFETTWHFRTYNLRELKSLLRSVPAFEHLATYSFHCDINAPVPFDGNQLDTILILRRRP